jgi:glutathione peroxidase
VPASPSIFDIPLTRIDGKKASLAEWRGDVLLIVNVASKCGFTVQYDGLEALYRQYRAKGFAVLGFPSNDFGGQEPGSEAEIADFCRATYGVEFPMFAKTAIKGPGKSPLYQALIAAKPLAEFRPDSAMLKRRLAAGKQNDGEVAWNFEKFLVDRAGRVIGRFAPDTKPDDPAIVAAIEQALARQPATV